jgi:hypothetical protein
LPLVAGDGAPRIRIHLIKLAPVRRANFLDRLQSQALSARITLAGPRLDGVFNLRLDRPPTEARLDLAVVLD